MVQRLPLATHDRWELVQVATEDDVEAAEWARCLKTLHALHPNGVRATLPTTLPVS